MIDSVYVTAWKGKAETEKEKREKRNGSSHAPAWYGSGWVWASMHCGVGNRWKRKIIGTARKSHCIPCISRGFFVYGFYPIAVKNHDKRNAENLNHSRFKRIAKPSSLSLATGTYEYNAHYINYHMLPPRVNAQVSVRQTNN